MRSSIVAFATAALTAPLLTLAAPAAAATECRDFDQGNTVVTRSCKVSSSRIGGLVEGGIWWDYKHGPYGQDGDVSLDVKDRKADGKCTIVKIWYRDPSGENLPETRRWKVCKGKTGVVRATLNTGQAGAGPGAPDGGPFPVYTKGYYSVWHCSGKKHKTCIRLWKQNVAQKKDPTD
jgi:hypothetical protein